MLTNTIQDLSIRFDMALFSLTSHQICIRADHRAGSIDLSRLRGEVEKHSERVSVRGEAVEQTVAAGALQVGL
jgi:hypothetical protein